MNKINFEGNGIGSFIIDTVTTETAGCSALSERVAWVKQSEQEIQRLNFGYNRKKIISFAKL
jgi:hypothetical protein